MSQLPKRHQHSILPQQRSQTGRFKPKPARPLGSSVPQSANGRPQSLPTMLTANNGAIGEK